MIDTHAHLHHAAFAEDRAGAAARAFEAGLAAMLEVNIDLAGWRGVRALAESDPRIFASVGIHPHDTGRATPRDLDLLAAELGHPQVKAVGETGLDYFRDYAPHDRQRDYFRRHVALARRHRLPLVVHARERSDGPSAHEDIFRILEEDGAGQVRGVLHCFSGGLPEARRAAALGFSLGIGGAITYAPRRSGPLLREIADTLGPGIFVLETDCPYLSPQPRRGSRNEPAHIPFILTALAGALGLAPEEVEQRTDAAARALFDLPSAAGGAGETRSAPGALPGT